ncbi:MAG TPA: DUF4136 domain-containing protein [Puia sp.]|jgi:hypothetical protein|nr:DUF4136 domain-containing protein [Puia sp.]
MRSIVYVLGTGFILAAMNACSPSVKVTTDYDRSASFAGYKTYHIYDAKGKGEISQLNADRIINAVQATMNKKGFTGVAENQDLDVNVMTVTQDKKTVTANTNYYGYGGAYRPYGYWGGAGGGSTTTFNAYDYKNGSLIIDIVDTKTQKMVWQGVGNADIDGEVSNPDKFIQDAVTKIMTDFPPGK